MSRWLSILAGLLVLTSAGAFAQNDLRPDPMPHLPPRLVEGLPVADQRFITRAADLSEAQVEAGVLAAEKAADPQIKELGRSSAATHEEMRAEIEELAGGYNFTIEPHASRAFWQGELQRLRGLEGQTFERAYMMWQVQSHLALTALYQAEASGSAVTALSSYAIRVLVDIQRRFHEVRELAASYGIAVDLVEQPPQY